MRRSERGVVDMAKTVPAAALPRNFGRYKSRRSAKRFPFRATARLRGISSHHRSTTSTKNCRSSGRCAGAFAPPTYWTRKSAQRAPRRSGPHGRRTAAGRCAGPTMRYHRESPSSGLHESRSCSRALSGSLRSSCLYFHHEEQEDCTKVTKLDFRAQRAAAPVANSGRGRWSFETGSQTTRCR